MVKGVSKQIVEINYTENDFVEKAILILNPSKSGLSSDLLSRKAGDYLHSILPLPERGKQRKWRWIAAVCGGAGLLAGAGVTAVISVLA